MKLVINKENLVIATHNNEQDIKDLYDHETLAIIRVPDNIRIHEFNDNFIGEDESEIVSLPVDPRIAWSLEEAKIHADKVIPDIAEECRTKLLSTKPGKIASYRAKEEVARRVLTEEIPNAIDVNLLQLEADNRDVTVKDLALMIVSRADSFNEISSFIDGESQRVKKAILDHESYEDIWLELENFEQAILAKIAA